MMTEQKVYISTSFAGMAAKYHYSKKCAAGKQRYGNICGGLMEYTEEQAKTIGRTLCSRCAARRAKKASAS